MITSPGVIGVLNAIPADAVISPHQRAGAASPGPRPTSFSPLSHGLSPQINSSASLSWRRVLSKRGEARVGLGHQLHLSPARTPRSAQPGPARPRPAPANTRRVCYTNRPTSATRCHRFPETFLPQRRGGAVRTPPLLVRGEQRAHTRVRTTPTQHPHSPEYPVPRLTRANPGLGLSVWLPP